MKLANGSVRLSASDLSNFLACRHLTVLDSRVACGELGAPSQFDLGFQELIERGEMHEARVLDRFRADGLIVVEIAMGRDVADEERAAATCEAMEAGVDVVYQGVLLVDDPGGLKLFGQPDFLVRSDRLAQTDGSAGFCYEVVDAKLARTAKARALLQAVFYSHLLAVVRGATPRSVHLALGNDQLVAFRVADFAAYERRIRSSRRFRAAICRVRMSRIRNQSSTAPSAAGARTVRSAAGRRRPVARRRHADDPACRPQGRSALVSGGSSPLCQPLPELKGASVDSLCGVPSFRRKLQVESEDCRRNRLRAARSRP